MGISNIIPALKAFGRTFQNGPKLEKRHYASGRNDRLTSDFVRSALGPNAEIASSLPAMRERCRTLERDDDYARGFFKALENNVIGSTGLKLQSKIKKASGSLDEKKNKIVETAWREFCKPVNFDVAGKLSFLGACRLALRSIARDGDVISRYHTRGLHGIQIQLLEADHLEENRNGINGGNTIHMGIERDGFKMPVAYYIFNNHPGEQITGIHSQRAVSRIPADEIIHPFIPERIGQARGVPWIQSAARRLRMLGGYEEAELVAARVSASKMGFLTRNNPDVEYAGEEDSDGSILMDTEPGGIEELPVGMDFKEWNPTHPNSSYSNFVKGVLRGVAAGIGISYTTLSQDLEGVNYSSIRAGLLDEREQWKMLQGWFVEQFATPIFERWANIQILTGVLPFPPDKMPEMIKPHFIGRRWAWVDPKKDIEASILSVESGFTSRRRIIEETGLDRNEIFEEIAEDEEIAIAKGLKIGGASGQSKPGKPENTEEKEDNSEDDK